MTLTMKGILGNATLLREDTFMCGYRVVFGDWSGESEADQP